MSNRNEDSSTLAHNTYGFGKILESLLKSNNAMATLIKERLLAPAPSTSCAMQHENEFNLLDSVEAVQEFEQKLISDPEYFTNIVSVVCKIEQ